MPLRGTVGSMTEQSASSAVRPLGFWVTLVGRLVEERHSAALEEHGVTRAQWHVLALLRRGPAPRDRVEQASAEGSGRSDELAELVESAWITEGDEFQLTERGRVATDALAEVVESIGAELDRAVTPQEAEVASAVLRRIAAELGWSEPTA